MLKLSKWVLLMKNSSEGKLVSYIREVQEVRELVGSAGLRPKKA